MTLEARSVLGNPFIGVYRIGVPTARGVFVSELSGGGCVHCSSTVAAHEILDELSDAVGLSLPAKPGVATDNKGRWAFWMSPRSWLVSVDADREGALVASVAERFPDRRVHASRFSDYLFWMSVSGEGAEDLLRQGGFLSVEETFWMSPRSWLVSVDADREGALVASVAERFPDRRVHASRFSDYLFWMSVSGEGAEDLLRQGGFLSVDAR